MRLLGQGMLNETPGAIIDKMFLPFPWHMPIDPLPGFFWEPSIYRAFGGHNHKPIAQFDSYTKIVCKRYQRLSA
jgi:hypothetical protein